MGDVIYFRKKSGEMNMESIFEVARYFLSKESMKHLKLQKLCYYSQAWYLAVTDKPLVSERFEAWQHGPVSPNLYQKYKQWGWYNISKYEGIVSIERKTREFLDLIYNLYGLYSGEELENLTHNEEPWIKAREGRGSSEYCTTDIKIEDMRNYYKNKLVKEES